MRTGKKVIGNNWSVFYVRLSSRKCLYKAEAKAQMDKSYSQAQTQISTYEKYIAPQQGTTVYNYNRNPVDWNTNG